LYLPNFILLPIFSKNLRSKFLVCFDRDYTVKAGAKITTFHFKNQNKIEVFLKFFFERKPTQLLIITHQNF